MSATKKPKLDRGHPSGDYTMWNFYNEAYGLIKVFGDALTVNGINLEPLKFIAQVKPDLINLEHVNFSEFEKGERVYAILSNAIASAETDTGDNPLLDLLRQETFGGGMNL